MSAGVTLAGVQDFLRQLGQVPERVERAGMRVITNAAADLAGQVRAAIPTVSGELGASVRVREDGPLLVRVVYGNDGDLDWATAYEKGSPPRTTEAGANRGRAPKAKVMARLAGKRRRRMNRELADALVQELRKL